MVSCNEKPKKEVVETTKIHDNFATLLDSYYEDRLKLNPIEATTAGDYRYNDIFTNNLSSEHITKTKTHFKNYKKEVSTFSDDDLTATEKLSKAILLWECAINLNEFNFNANHTPNRPNVVS